MLLLLAVTLQASQLPQRRVEPELRIAAADAGEEFTNAFALAEAGGKVFIADLKVPTIFRFDGQGHLEGKVGRTGQGPGEYRYPTMLGVRGDTLWAGDMVQRRILLYTPEGRPARTITLVGGSSGAFAYSADGTLLGIPGWSSSRAAPDQPAELPVLRFRADGTRSDTLLKVAVQLGQLQLDLSDGTFLIGPQPFDDSPLVVASPVGDGFVVVDRRSTGPAEFRVTRYGADGTRRWVTRTNYAPGPLDQAVIDSVVHAKMEPAAPGFAAIPEPVVRKGLWIPPRLIPVLSAGLAPDGTLWLRRPSPIGGPAKYTVFDKDGKPSFEISVPQGQLLGFGNGAIWIGSKDEDDLPVVTRYRVR